ncbi:MAG: helix-turn-helix domain-containing protein [Paludibacter sp.]
MITADDIKLLIASGEGYNAEFKVSVPSKVKELTEEVCAFANAAGGVVLIGVNDQNQMVGVSIDNAKRSAIQNSLSDITPRLSCSLSFVEVDGKNIGVVEVPSGENKPYVLSGAIYVRIGPNSQKLTTAEQMRDFFQQADKIYFDEASCPVFHPDSMVDQDFLQLFKTEARLSASVSDEQIFSNLKLQNNTSEFKNGAVLFFGKEPEAIIDTAITRCVAYRGTDKRFIKDDKPYGGNLYSQYRQSLDWLHSKLDVAYDIEGQGSGPRKEIWEIPETVFKEAIINALSHRDYYDKGAKILIEVFDDRVEISNPGGLVSAIPLAEFGKRSHSRNPLIFGLFARMHLVEQVGSGINRMNDLMKAAGLTSPIYNTDGMFTVILLRSPKSVEEPVKKPVEKSSVKIIEQIKGNPNITIPEISGITGLSISAVEKQIRKLKQDKKIERFGSKKNGYWIVL